MKDKILLIQNEALFVQVNLLGASLWSIKDADSTEYLWQGNKKYWGDRAPVLFPYIARLTDGKYILNGQEYKMDIHGFAKDSMFEIVNQTESELTLRIRDTEETYIQYPYRFVFEITYRIDETRLDVIFHIENKDDKTMFFGVGGHPGFNVPLSEHERFEDYYLEFVGEGEAQRVMFSDDCFVLDASEAFPLTEGKKLILKHNLFDNDAIVLKDMPKTIRLKSNTGRKQICVTYKDMDYLGIWHWPQTDAPYVCIEPWSSLPSRKNVVEDFSKQRDLLSLFAGDKVDIGWSVQICNC